MLIVKKTAAGRLAGLRAAAMGLACITAAAMGQAGSAHPKTHSDWDRRAAMTLFNTIQAGAVADHSTLQRDALMKLDAWKEDEKTGERIFAVYFGSADESQGVDERGYYRIGTSSRLSKLNTTQGPTRWNVMAPDPKTDAEVFSRTVESAKIPYKEVGARKAYGSVVLSVSQHLKMSADPAPERLKIISRFHHLVKQAQASGLLGRAVLLLLRNGEEKELKAGEPLPLETGVPSQQLRLKLLVLGADNLPVKTPFKRLYVSLGGRVANFTKIQGPLQFADGVYYLENAPEAVFDVQTNIDFDQFDGLLMTAMDMLSEPGRHNAPQLHIKYGVKQ